MNTFFKGTKPLIIGLCGSPRAGKDTAGEFLKLYLKTLGVSVAKYAIAWPIKRRLAKQLQISIADIEKDKERYRPLLQEGAEVELETNGENYWLDMLKPFPSVDVLILGDVRRAYECAWVHGLGGMICHVTRGSEWEAKAKLKHTHRLENEWRKCNIDKTMLNPSNSRSVLMGQCKKWAKELAAQIAWGRVGE